MSVETINTPQVDRGAWFDDLVSTLRSHEVQLETRVASDPLRKLYDELIAGNADELLRRNKADVQRHFVSKILFEYLEIVSKSDLANLAFDYNDSEVLVWAEIADDRDDLERVLIMAEAKVNAKYHDYGFDMNTTIVEEGDFLSVPSHYKVFAERKQ